MPLPLKRTMFVDRIHWNVVGRLPICNGARSSLEDKTLVKSVFVIASGFVVLCGEGLNHQHT